METHIELKSKKTDDIFVFEFVGELDETNVEKTFNEVYSTIGEFDGKQVILNMSGLKYLNSKSIGYIADIFGSLEEGEGKMCISNANEEVLDTLDLVGIPSIIPMADTEEKAVEILRA